jgi:hypothetical protein
MSKNLVAAYQELADKCALLDRIDEMETAQAKCKERMTKDQELGEAIEARHKALADKHSHEVDLHDRLLAAKKQEATDMKALVVQTKQNLDVLLPKLAQAKAEHAAVTGQLAAILDRLNR